MCFEGAQKKRISSELRRNNSNRCVLRAHKKNEFHLSSGATIRIGVFLVHTKGQTFQDSMHAGSDTCSACAHQQSTTSQIRTSPSSSRSVARIFRCALVARKARGKKTGLCSNNTIYIPTSAIRSRLPEKMTAQLIFYNISVVLFASCFEYSILGIYNLVRMDMSQTAIDYFILQLQLILYGGTYFLATLFLCLDHDSNHAEEKGSLKKTAQAGHRRPLLRVCDGCNIHSGLDCRQHCCLLQ